VRSSFTNKLEGMFKDIDLSRDIMTTFRQSARSMARIGDTELNVSVCPNSSASAQYQAAL
jgi:cullin-4